MQVGHGIRGDDILVMCHQCFEDGVRIPGAYGLEGPQRKLDSIERLA